MAHLIGVVSLRRSAGLLQFSPFAGRSREKGAVAMPVDEHAEEFVGLPVRDYDPEEGIADPAGSAYRLSFSWNDAEEMGSFGERLALFLEDPNAGQVRG